MSAPTLSRSPAGERGRLPELDRRHRIAVLAICCTSMLVVIMDNSIVNVALPAIRADLRASVSALQWTIDAYTLVLAAFLLLAGSTADRIGRRRTFQLGLVSFGAGSLLCSVAPGPGWLIGARAVQALGGTMLNPVALAIVANTFTDRAERARAIGVFGSVAGLSLGLGPVLGGALVDSIGWRSIFWINAPVIAVALVCTALFVPDSRASRPRRFDPVGQLLVVAVLASLVYVIIESPRLGWTSPLALGLLGVAAAGVLGILTCETRRADPLLDLRFFRSVPFCGAMITAVAGLFGYGSFLFLNTMYLQDVRGYSALRTGMCLLPVGVLIVLLSPLTGRIVGTRGARLPLLIAGAALAAAGVAATRVGPATPLPVLLGGYLLFGIFLGTINPPITTSAVSGMPISMAGVAGSLASASRQVGVTLGVAVAGSVIGPAVGRGGAAFTRAAHAVWWVMAGLGVMIFVLGLVTTSRRAQRSARRAADLFEG